jgi:hypothetical protein
LFIINQDRRKNLNGRHFVVTANAFRPLMYLKVDGKTWQGMSIDIMNHIKDKMNFTYSIVPSPDGRYGSPTLDGGWDGEIGQLLKKKADIRYLWFNSNSL